MHFFLKLMRIYFYKYIQITYVRPHVKPDFNIHDQDIFSHFKYFNSLYVVIGNSLLFYCVLTFNNTFKLYSFFLKFVH